MPNWDENSPQLKTNLEQALRDARDSAKAKEEPTLDMPRKWQQRIMEGLSPTGSARKSWYGMFRGESGQEHIGVRVGSSLGTPANKVQTELNTFITTVKLGIEKLDAGLFYKDGEIKQLTDSDIDYIIKLMALVHGEWIRIHPFANGNGRTARMWANWIAMRYGLPPFVRLRPRPRGGYEWASSLGMNRKWRQMVDVFKNMLDEMSTNLRIDGDPE